MFLDQKRGGGDRPPAGNVLMPARAFFVFGQIATPPIEEVHDIVLMPARAFFVFGPDGLFLRLAAEPEQVLMPARAFFVFGQCVRFYGTAGNNQF